MQPATWMTAPSWFLVAGLPWPEDHADAEVAEAACDHGVTRPAARGSASCTSPAPAPSISAAVSGHFSSG